MQIELDIPDYTSLAKRAAKLGVSLDVAKHTRADRRGGRQHRPEGFRRRRMEDAQARQEQTPHLAEIALGGESGHAGDRSGNPDGEQLRRRQPSGRPAGSGDQARSMGFTATALTTNGRSTKRWRNAGSKAIIPPQRNAKIKQHGNSSGRPLSRDVAIREIRRRGRRRWKERVGYHRRSLSETAMYRMKCCFGDHLKNRLIPNQQTETRLRSKILNKFTHLGLPEFPASSFIPSGTIIPS